MKKTRVFEPILIDATVILHKDNELLTVKLYDLANRIQVPLDRFFYEDGRVQTNVRPTLTEQNMFQYMVTESTEDTVTQNLVERMNKAIFDQDYLTMRKVIHDFRAFKDEYCQTLIESLIQTRTRFRRTHEPTFRIEGDDFITYDRVRDSFRCWPLSMIQAYGWDSWWETAERTYELDSKLKYEAKKQIYG